MSLDPYGPNGAPLGYFDQAGATAYLIDPAGTYSALGAAAEPTSDLAGAYGAVGASAPTLAAAGTYIPVTGAAYSAAEIVDPAGAYSSAGASAPMTDAAGAYSAAGASAPTPATDTYIPVTGATSSAAEIVDPAGTYSSAGASAPTTDAAGAYIPVAGATSSAAEIFAPTGAYRAPGASAPKTDPAGGHGELGASAPTLAAAGASIPIPRATSAAAEIVDPTGAYNLVQGGALTTDPAGSRRAAGASAPTLAATGAVIPITGAASPEGKVSPPGTYLPPGATAPMTDPGGTYSGSGATAPTTDPAGTYSTPYELNRLFIEANQITPANAVISFTSETAVANYYGSTSREASEAEEFFAGYAGTSATMMFTRIGLGQRPHLLGNNIGNLTLTQLQSINGSVALTFDGYIYSGYVNLSGTASFKTAAHAIQLALNSDLPVGAMTAGDSITSETNSFTGYTVHNELYVTSITSGSVEIGAIISGKGINAGAQLIEDRKS